MQGMQWTGAAAATAVVVAAAGLQGRCRKGVVARQIQGKAAAGQMARGCPTTAVHAGFYLSRAMTRAGTAGESRTGFTSLLVCAASAAAVLMHGSMACMTECTVARALQTA